MKSTIIAALVTLILPGSAVTASAQGDDRAFDLHNDTSWTILSFQARRADGVYSRDLLPVWVLEPGQHATLYFPESDDACEYQVKVRFENGEIWEQKLTSVCYLHTFVVHADGTMENLE